MDADLKRIKNAYLLSQGPYGQADQAQEMQDDVVDILSHPTETTPISAEEKPNWRLAHTNTIWQPCICCIGIVFMVLPMFVIEGLRGQIRDQETRVLIGLLVFGPIACVAFLVLLWWWVRTKQAGAILTPAEERSCDCGNVPYLEHKYEPCPNNPFFQKFFSRLRRHPDRPSYISEMPRFLCGIVCMAFLLAFGLTGWLWND